MASKRELWLDERSGGVVSSRVAWARAAEVLERASWSEESLRFFGDRFDNASSLSKLCESANLDERASGEAVKEAIAIRSDASPYSFDQWIAALEILLQTLVREGRKSGLQTQLGYLACSAEYLETGVSSISFPEAVADFVSQFGFEG